MRRPAGLLAAVGAALVLAVPTPEPASAEGTLAVAYRPPVDAPLIDLFRPAAFEAGNRGVDYATRPGQPVGAAAAGRVVFAGRVGAGLHVVVLHADGIRTSYSFLAATAVRRGERVAAGQTVGTAGGALHFGARAGEAYVDPMALLGGAGPRVRLVPDPAPGSDSEARERSHLERTMRLVRSATVAVGTTALAWAREGAGPAIASRIDEVRGWLHYASALGVPLPWRVLVAASLWRAEQEGCTPPDAPPPPPGGRRLVVLVAGLWSASGRGAVLDVDTAALGYAPGDVSQFSYRADGPYDPSDTQSGIEAAAVLLGEHVRRLQRTNPGVPVDVIAHSQGGLVARAALAGGLQVANLVTLGTPHRGADLATAAAMVATTPAGAAVLWGVSEVSGSGIDLHAPSVLDMAETSELMRRLARAPLAPGTRVVSIAARHDLVVPSPRSRLAGAANVVVTLSDGLPVHDHARLPGSAPAHREMALALAGLGPTCETLVDHLVDAVAGQGNAFLGDVLGAGLTAGGHWVDRHVPVPSRH
jgi:hypothetical protein